jgi:hypothetical protein
MPTHVASGGEYRGSCNRNSGLRVCGTRLGTYHGPLQHIVGHHWLYLREVNAHVHMLPASCEVSGRYSWLRGCPFGDLR